MFFHALKFSGTQESCLNIGDMPCVQTSNEFNKFNNTGAGILGSIYHMTFRLI